MAWRAPSAGDDEHAAAAKHAFVVTSVKDKGAAAVKHAAAVRDAHKEKEALAAELEALKPSQRKKRALAAGAAASPLLSPSRTTAAEKLPPTAAAAVACSPPVPAASPTLLELLAIGSSLCEATLPPPRLAQLEQPAVGLGHLAVAVNLL